MQVGCASATNCVVTMVATDGLGETLADNFLFPASLNTGLTLVNPQFNVTSVYVGPTGPGSFTVAFSGQAVAPFTWLETSMQGYFDSNAFVFTGMRQYNTVNFYTRNATMTAADLKASIQVGGGWGCRGDGGGCTVEWHDCCRGVRRCGPCSTSGAATPCRPSCPRRKPAATAAAAGSAACKPLAKCGVGVGVVGWWCRWWWWWWTGAWRAVFAPA